MDTAAQVREEENRFVVSGEMSIYTAATLKSELFDRCNASAAPCRIDVSEVTVLDTAGVQILLLTYRMAMAGGREFLLLNPSEPAREALNLIGVHELLPMEVTDPVAANLMAPAKKSAAKKRKSANRKRKSAP
jgi:anti-anti-sigma factor